MNQPQRMNDQPPRSDFERLDEALRDFGRAIAEMLRLPQICDWLTRLITRRRTM